MAFRTRPPGPASVLHILWCVEGEDALVHRGRAPTPPLDGILLTPLFDSISTWLDADEPVRSVHPVENALAHAVAAAHMHREQVLSRSDLV